MKATDFPTVIFEDGVEVPTEEALAYGTAHPEVEPKHARHREGWTCYAKAQRWIDTREMTRIGLGAYGDMQLVRAPERSDIEILLLDGTWHARVLGADEAPTRKLFGTNLLPTPYTVDTPAATVLESLRGLNPGKSVTLA